MLAILAASVVAVTKPEDWMFGDHGEAGTCPGSTALKSLGTSGRDPDCDGYGWEADCENIPTHSLHSTQYPHSYNESAYLGGQWYCGSNGANVQCPAGQVVTGICASGHNPNCADAGLGCGTQVWTGIYCSTPAVPQSGPKPIVNDGHWISSGGSGEPTCAVSTCAANEVACGACSSGSEADCDQYSNGKGHHYTGLKCCPITYACAPGEALGVWVPMGYSSVPNVRSVTQGVLHSAGSSSTKGWGKSATESVNAGFRVFGIGASSTVSHTESEQFSQTYESIFEYETQVTVTDYWSPGVVWTFMFAFLNNSCGGRTMAGGGKDSTFTNSLAEPPCCLPGLGVGRGPCLPDRDNVQHNLCTSNQTLPAPTKKPPDPTHCQLQGNITGEWVDLDSRPTAFEVTFTHGVEHSSGTSNTHEWGESASWGISAGFSFMGIGASASVSHSTSHYAAQTNEALLVNTTTTKQKYSFPASPYGGVAWQFQFKFNDTCGGSTLYTRDIAWTPDARWAPCCLPGFFKQANVTVGKDVCLQANDESAPHDLCNISFAVEEA